MADDNALRSTLEELREMDKVDEGRRPSGPAQLDPPGKSSGGSSLLADLLNETSDEAQRELDDIKAQLQARRQAEADEKQAKDDARREQLDTLRREEAHRREDMIRQREEKRNGGKRGTIEQPIEVPRRVAAPTPVAPEPKKSAAPMMVTAVLVLGAGVAAFYFYTQANQPPPAAPAPPIAVAPPAAPVAEPVGLTKAAEPAPVAKPEPVAQPVAPAVVVAAAESRQIETEEGFYQRRMPEFTLAKKTRRGGKASGRRNTGSKGPKRRVKIKLNMGTMK